MRNNNKYIVGKRSISLHTLLTNKLEIMGLICEKLDKWKACNMKEQYALDFRGSLLILVLLMLC